jgi:N-acyl-D-aspartate/D-glutamate deacylase
VHYEKLAGKPADELRGAIMGKEFDLVIRGGTVLDGTGAAAIEADVAIAGGRIQGIGRIKGGGTEELDARGLLVTPGFVDIHTHYDGQVTWTERLSPSSEHGVSTVVMGNCGVGFAPCKPENREELIRLMEGVEDIPEVVMAEGIPWNWETFPEYMDALAARRTDLDFAAQIPHSPIRVHVMGKRGADREPSTEQDRAQMTAIVREAIQAGALGVSSSRLLNHRTKAGKLAPTIEASMQEFEALAEGLRQAGAGVFEMSPRLQDADEDLEVLRRMAVRSGRPGSFSLAQVPANGDGWRRYLELLEKLEVEGLQIRGQVLPRPIGALFGLAASLNAFSYHPSFQPLAALPLAEKLAALRQPELRARLLAEKADFSNPATLAMVRRLGDAFELGDPPNYEPAPDQLLKVRAERMGVALPELLYDLMLKDEGRNLILLPLANYAHGNLDATGAMLGHSRTIVGLGDGGAHYGMICDASYSTTLLAYWGRDRKQGRLPLPQIVRALTSVPADAVGLGDRGRLAVGLKADVNLIDHGSLRLGIPKSVQDLPAGGRRFRQEVSGYVASIVSGQITYRNGEATGAMPGRLVRGARAAA